MKTTAWIATLIITAASATAFAADTPDTTRADAGGSSAATAQAQQESGGLTREQVRAALFEARSKGEVPETEADMDVAQIRKHRPQGR